ncbi:MAG: hypothetical protein LBG76_00825 [Treponema sp.]|jgi:tetratricopeptide (TPR) repeat protein|nr:hypothetical protein [Treponema sp.]
MNKTNRGAGAFRLPIFFFLFTILCAPAPAEPGTFRYDYTYDFWGYEEPSIPAFTVERTIDFRGALTGVDDIFAGGGRLFIADARESRILVLDGAFKPEAMLKTLSGPAGEGVSLSNPEGVFFHEKTNRLFIADTGAERILVLDGDAYSLERIITRPAGMSGGTRFAPSKIVVDNAERIYFVVQGGGEGIVELTPGGDFSRYFGVNKPRVNLLELFWRMFATAEQRAKMNRVFAPAFNNIDIDAKGFIYASSYDNASAFALFRLNPKGENVLIEKEKPSWVEDAGDLFGFPSEFMDVAVNGYGAYAALDRRMGRIFVYDFFGELLTIINIPAQAKGSLPSPGGIAWFGDYLVAADRQLNTVYVYALTAFGKLAFGAAERYYRGEWEAAAGLLEEAVRLNANYNSAYSGIGKYYLMEGDYGKALYYLKLGQNRPYYSKAFNQYRSQWIKNNFVWFALAFMAGITALVFTEFRYHQKTKKGGEKNAQAA